MIIFPEAVQGDFVELCPFGDKVGQSQGQGRKEPIPVTKDERQPPVDGVPVRDELDVAHPHDRLGQDVHRQGHGSRQRDRPFLWRGEGSCFRPGGPGSGPLRATGAASLSLAAEEEGQEDVPRAGHGLGQKTVVVDAVGRALRQHEVEEDGLGPAGLEEVQDRGVDLPRPGPAEALLLFVRRRGCTGRRPGGRCRRKRGRDRREAGGARPMTSTPGAGRFSAGPGER